MEGKLGKALCSLTKEINYLNKSQSLFQQRRRQQPKRKEFEFDNEEREKMRKTVKNLVEENADKGREWRKYPKLFESSQSLIAIAF